MTPVAELELRRQRVNAGVLIAGKLPTWLRCTLGEKLIVRESWEQPTFGKLNAELKDGEFLRLCLETMFPGPLPPWFYEVWGLAFLENKRPVLAIESPRFTWGDTQDVEAFAGAVSGRLEHSSESWSRPGESQRLLIHHDYEVPESNGRSKHTTDPLLDKNRYRRFGRT